MEGNFDRQVDPRHSEPLFRLDEGQRFSRTNQLEPTALQARFVGRGDRSRRSDRGSQGTLLFLALTTLHLFYHKRGTVE